MAEFDITNNSETEEVGEQEKDNKRFSYPSRKLSDIITFVSKIYTELGNDLYHSKEDIAKVHGLSVNYIKTTLSTAQQYNLLELKHGTGYKVTPLFIRIFRWEDEQERISGIIESLRSPDIYNPIFTEYNGRVLPSNQGLTNILVRRYNLKELVAQRIAEGLIENLKEYNLLNGSNVLNLQLPFKGKTEDKTDNSTNNEAPKETENQKIKRHDSEVQTIEVTIPMKNKSKAYLRFPEEYTNEDMDKIARIVQAYKELAPE